MKLTPIVERRFAPLTGVELRVDEDDKQVVHFRGHASVFNQVAQIGGKWGWREVVAPGAFKKTIKEADVRFLFNHDPHTVMARSTNATLRLSEDATGLLTEADLDTTDWDVQRLVPKLDSKNVTQMSIGFRTIVDEWDEEPEDGGLPIRTVKEIHLFDVSPVTFPAFEGTDAEMVSVRSLLDGRPDIRELLERRKAKSADTDDAPSGGVVTVRVVADTTGFEAPLRAALDRAQSLITETSAAEGRWDQDKVRKAAEALQELLAEDEPSRDAHSLDPVRAAHRKRQLVLARARLT